jgi:hypothetical protein
VPYLQALGLQRDELVQALGLSFTVSTLALAGGLFWRGALGSGELSASLLVLDSRDAGHGVRPMAAAAHQRRAVQARSSSDWARSAPIC